MNILLLRMTRIISISTYSGLLLLGVLLMSCVASDSIDQKNQYALDQQQNHTTYSGWGFSVHTPDTITVNSQSCIDFILYSFVAKSEVPEKKGLLFAYVGNHPDFGDDTPKNSTKQSFRIDGLKAKTIRWKDDKNLFYREVLVKMPYKYELESDIVMPAYIHFWYKELSQEERKIADDMIMSVRSLK